MIQDPGTIRLIHDTMIQEALQRNGPERHRYRREPFPVRGPVTVVRVATASALYRLASRVAPTIRPSNAIPPTRTGTANSMPT